MTVSETMVLAGAKALFLRDVEEDVCDGTWDENYALHERILADARACLAAAIAVNSARPLEICNVLRSLSLKTIGNDAAETIEALQTQVAALNAALSDQAGGWQEFSGLTPIDKPLLLWFVGRNAPVAAHACAIGSISSHQPGMVWTDGDYRPVEWFSRWRLLPEGPPPSSTAGEGK